MPNRCTVCDSPELDRIDRALATDALTCRGAAARFNLDRSAIWRHRARHLPLKLEKARAAAEVASAEQLLADIEEVRRVVRVVLAQAMTKRDSMTDRDRRTALSAVDRHLAAISLMAKVSGRVPSDVSVNVSLAADPGWLELRDALVEALRPYPQAHLAVVRVIEQRTAA